MSRYFEDFTEGEIIRHEPGRTVTEADNVLFCALTMNPQPLYLNNEYAKGTEFGRTIANPLFVLALSGGLFVYETSLGTIVANLAVGDVRFLKPVFPGDTIHSESRVLEKRDSKNPATGIIEFEQRVVNQHGEVVMTWRRTPLCLRRPKA